MENNPTPPVVPVNTPRTDPVQPIHTDIVPDPVKPADSVWVSKEEYERLRTVYSYNNNTAVIGSGPSIAVAETPKGLNRFKDFWVYAGAVVAIIVFLGLTSEVGVFLTFPLTVGLVTFAIMALISLVKAAAPRMMAGVGTPVQSQSNGYEPAKKSSVGRVVLITLGIMVLSPFIAMAVLFVFLAIIFSSPGAKGS